MKKITLLFAFTLFILFSFNTISLSQESRELDSKQSVKIYSPHNNIILEKPGAELWSPLGPKGITVNDIAIDPLNSNKIIAGGLAGMYITTNGGTNWNIINTMFYNVWIGGVKFHPTNNNIVIANGYSRLTSSAYIARSTDGGNNWTIVKQTYNLNYGKIVFAKSNPNIVYSEGYYLYKSTDAGATWTEYNNLARIEEYDVYEQDPNKIYAFAYHPTTYAYEFFYSQDGGVTWTKTKTMDFFVNAIKISPTNFNQVFAGSTDRNAAGGNGFLKSVDGGVNWTSVYTGWGKFTKISFIGFHPDNSNIIYSCGPGTSLMKSTNGGTNWTDIMPNIIDRYVYGVEFDSQKNLYVYTGSNIYKTTNETAYQSISGDLVNCDIFQARFSPSNYSIIYLASLGGVLKTTNGGQTWVQKSNGIYDNDIFSIGINPQNSNQIFAGSFGSLVYRTNDGGENWVEKSTGLTGLNGGAIYEFLFHPQNPNTVFVVEGTSKIFMSTNSGDNWTEYKVNNNTESIKYLDMSSSSSNIWYAYTASGGKIYKTTDFGINWSLIGTTLNLYSVTVDATNPSVLYADQYINSTDNISKSTDSGYSWSIYYPNLYVRDIYSLPGATNTVFAASWASGVYKTTNGGTNWNQMNTGLTYISCFEVRNKPGSTTEFITVTYGGSIFGYNYTPTGIKKDDQILPSRYILNNNYPNPFNPATTISFSIPKNDFVTIKIIDLAGREVSTLVNEYLNMGSYKLQFDASKCTSGVYFVRMSASNFLQTKKIILMK